MMQRHFCPAHFMWEEPDTCPRHARPYSPSRDAKISRMPLLARHAAWSR